MAGPFEPISSQDDEKKGLAASFHKHVGQWSAKWKSFTPVFIRKKDFIAYDLECQEWREMPSLSFLPWHCFDSRSHWRIERGLLLVIGYPGGLLMTTNLEIFVANNLTRSWKKLPPLQHGFKKVCGAKLMIPMKSMYKVVVFEDDFPGINCVAQIYDPNLDVWSSRHIISVSESFGNLMLSDWVNLNGVLYRVLRLGTYIDLGPPSDVLRAKSVRGQSNEMTWGLLPFHVNEGTFEILQMGRIDLLLYKDNVELAVCNGSLLMLVYNAPHPGVAKGLIVLKIHLEC